MIPQDIILETSKVFLRPIEENDYDAFLSLAKQDEEMWQHFSLNLADEAQFFRSLILWLLLFFQT